MKISATKVASIKEPGRYAVGDGVYLQITGDKGRSWIFRYQLAGTARHMGLGPIKLLSLKEARDRAIDAKKLLLDGIDPIEARDLRRTQQRLKDAKAITFRSCAEQYITDNKVAWRNEKHRAQWKSTLETYADPVIGALSVGDVDTGLVLKVLRQPVKEADGKLGTFWSAKPETAGRVRGRIETILDWAKAQGFREGENPARWRGHLESVLPAKAKVAKVQHHKAMPYAELAAFMARLRLNHSMSAKALEFTILTAARTGETIGATRSEIDMVQKVWIIPGSRMKAEKDHRVPLCGRAIEIIESSKHNQEYLFPGANLNRPLSNMAMLELLRGMTGNGITVHGFRSTFMDWGHEVTHYPKEMLDIALAHTVDDKVEAAYRRGDMFEKRRKLMADWAAYCAGA
jgi:integrase